MDASPLSLTDDHISEILNHLERSLLVFDEMSLKAAGEIRLKSMLQAVRRETELWRVEAGRRSHPPV